jgi:hypothetical protein
VSPDAQRGWHTLGLRGTASNEYSVDNLFIPHERAIYRDDPRDRQTDSPLYRFTSNQLYSIGFGGVALGIARGTMDSFLALPRKKTRRGAGKPMVENNVRPVARGAIRGEVAVRALFPARRRTRRWKRRDGPGSADPPAPCLDLGHSIVTADRFTTVDRWRCSRKIRSNAVCAILTRSRNRAGADTALRDGRLGHAWPVAGKHLLTVDKPGRGRAWLECWMERPA